MCVLGKAQKVLLSTRVGFSLSLALIQIRNEIETNQEFQATLLIVLHWRNYVVFGNVLLSPKAGPSFILPITSSYQDDEFSYTDFAVTFFLSSGYSFPPLSAPVKPC